MNRTLTVYFSWGGHTQKAAELIQACAGGDVFRVEPAVTYSPVYKDCCAVAVGEWKSGARPEILGFVENIEAYDRIFVCYPLWCGTMPMAMYTFLEHYDLSGKKLHPLCTNEGSGFANSLNDLKQICPGAEICGEMEIRGSKVDELTAQITDWVAENLK